MPVRKGSKHTGACLYEEGMMMRRVGFHDQVKIIDFNPCDQPDYHFLRIERPCAIF